MDGESGEITIDVLTRAYDDINLIPANYHRYLENKDDFVGEVGRWFGITNALLRPFHERWSKETCHFTV